MKNTFIISLLLIFLLSACGGEKFTEAIIETPMGNMKVMLYNSTPQHRDNFIKLVKEGFYDSLLFHRVMPDFMIQGGDPQSKTAKKGQQLGVGGPGYTIPQEIGAPHIRGALSAARLPDNQNPKKASSGSQFYIVDGSKQSDDDLNNFERFKKIKYNEVQRKLYKEKGGYPALDIEYTVFGEVIEGFDVIDKISTVPRDPYNRPFEDIRMSIKLVE